MVLGFKKQFVAPILANTKIHTIRRDEHRRWQSGVAIQMATGVRTKSYNCFKKAVCLGTQYIFMSYDWMLHISIGHRELYPAEKEILAKNDGFTNFEEFEAFWYPELMKDKYQCYSGRIVHWTEYRYQE